MKKRGFTLIELLAVIVVLAIIALIATPIVMNTIKNAKKGSAERGADNYIKQVETAIATSKLDGKDVADGTYTIDQDGNLTGTGLPDGKLTIEMNGEKPKSGSIVIKNGQVTTDSSMTIGDYTVSYNPTTKKYEATEKGNTVTKLCTKKDGVDLNNLTYGNEFTCELGDNDTKTFYVLETSGDNVSLIMNANIDSNGKAITSSDATDKGYVAWITDEDWAKAGGVVTDEMKNDEGPCQWSHICLTIEYGPITAKSYLLASTASWTKLNQSQITLPTAYQIATAAGKNFDNDTEVSELPTWLYDYIKTNASLPERYWTSTTYASNSKYHDYEAWFVHLNGGIARGSINSDSTIGVRPVITIPKSQLN